MLMVPSFFNSSEESILETSKTSEKYEKASGAKIHKNKNSGIILRSMEK